MWAACSVSAKTDTRPAYRADGREALVAIITAVPRARSEEAGRPSADRVRPGACRAAEQGRTPSGVVTALTKPPWPCSCPADTGGGEQARDAAAPEMKACGFTRPMSAARGLTRSSQLCGSRRAYHFLADCIVKRDPCRSQLRGKGRIKLLL